MNDQNDKLKYCLVGMYKKFVDEVDPKSILDFLIEKRVISIEEREKIITNNTRQEKCRTMLDKFFTTSNPKAFVFLKEALQESYSWIAQELEQSSKQIQIDHNQTKNNHPISDKEEMETNSIIHKMKNQIKNLENQLNVKNEEIIKLKNHIEILEYQIKIAASSIFKSEDVLPGRENSNYSCLDEADCTGANISCEEISEDEESSENSQTKGLEIIDKSKIHELRKLPRYCQSAYDLYVGVLDSSNKLVSLKELLDRNQSIESFPELALLKNLNHPRIANLLGRSSLDSPRPFVVFESSPLTNVLRFLKKPNSLHVSNKLVANWIVQMACGLDYLHENRILHRSIFASNIILCNSGNSIKITNFQNAVMLKTKNYILEGEPISRAECTAPEIINQNKWSPATDVWSFGLTILKMWVRGFKIFPGMTLKDITEFLSNSNIESIETFLNKHIVCEDHAAIKKTIQKCLNVNESCRPVMAELSSFSNYLTEEIKEQFTKKRKNEHMISCKKPVRGMTSLSGILYVIFMSSSSIKRYDLKDELLKLKSIKLGSTPRRVFRSYFKKHRGNGTLTPIKMCSNNLKSIDSSVQMQCLYVLDVGQLVVFQINVQRQKITRSWTVPPEATSLSVTLNNTIIVGCCCSLCIAREYNSEGVEIARIRSGSISDGPWRMYKVDELHYLVLHGSIYLPTEQELCMLDSDGLKSSGYGDKSFNKISDVMIHHPSGQILLADVTGNRIVSLDKYLKSQPTELLNIHDSIIAPSSIYILENLLFVGLTSGNIYCFEFS